MTAFARKIAHRTLALALVLAPLSLVACGKSAQVAKIPVGEMPSGATFKGVWFNRVWGELNLVPNGEDVVGRWSSDTGGKWGQLTGKITGDVIHFDWEEHKRGYVGPNGTRSGKGYFKYIPANPPDTAHLKGEWGFENDEVGGGEWDCTLESNVEPDLSKIGGGDATDVPDWDKEKKKAPTP